MLYLQLFSLLMLLFIFFQDIKYRAVYWICFPLLAALLFFIKCLFTGVGQTLEDAAMALFFLGIQLLLLWGYFSIKHRKAVNLSKDHLGWGDVLFLLAIVFYLSPINYVLFYVLSLLLVLIYALVNQLLNANHDKQIPLAGLQAMLLGIVISVDHFLPGFNLYDDSWISF